MKKRKQKDRSLSLCILVLLLFLLAGACEGKWQKEDMQIKQYERSGKWQQQN